MKDFDHSTLTMLWVDLGMVKVEHVIATNVHCVFAEAARSNIHVHLVAQLLAIYTFGED